MFLFVSIVSIAFSALLLLRIAQLAARRSGDLVIDEASVRVGRQPPVARDRLAASILDRSGATPVLRFVDTEGREVLAVSMSPGLASQTCADLGLAAPAERFAVWMGGPWRYLALAPVASLALFATFATLDATPLAPLARGLAFLLPWLMLAIARGTRATVFDTGVSTKSWTAQHRIPLRSIARVEQGEKALVLHLRDGGPIRLRVFSSRKQRESILTAARLRLEVAMARHEAASVGRADVHAALAPQGGTAREWLNGLRAIARPGYRDARLPPEELWRVVEDASESESDRAAAAYVLGIRPDESTRERLRLVSNDTSTTPRFRVAIAALVDGDEDRIEETAGRVLVRRAR